MTEMRLVMVTWRDAFGCSTDWEEIEDPFPAPKVMTCRSVGWLAHDGEECLVLIPHITEEHDVAQQGCGDMTIPRSAVVTMSTLEVVTTPKDSHSTI